MNSSPDNHLVRWENVTFSYGENSKHNVLENVNLSVNSNRFTVISGPSGCGKSTLLYLAAGLYPSNGGTLRGGQITVNGTVPDSLPPDGRAELLTVVFQNPDLQFCMDTAENEIIFCLENICLPREEIDSRLDDALSFCGASHLRRRLLSTLSGGEKQRVMLACAVALRSRWLLLDEPFANLDRHSAADLIQKLRRLHRERGVGIIAVDHDPWLWRDGADELIILAPDGSEHRRIPFADTSAEAFSSLGITCPHNPYQSEKPKKISADTYPLEIENLTVLRGGKPVIKGLSARFRAGRIHAVIGESGCGKSTLFNTLCGLEKYEGGIFINGREMKKMRKKDVRGAMGFVFQNPQDQFVADTVLEEIALSLRGRGEGDVEGEARRILKDIGLWRHRNLSPYMLSQGQQRRLGAAALLAYRCPVLICDEPTYAQDRSNVMAIMDGLQRQVTENGLTLIFSTHDTMLAENYADHIYEMREGRLYEKN